MKPFILSLLLLMGITISQAQSLVFFNTGYADAESIIRSADGNIIGLFRDRLVKMSPDGDVIWQSTVPANAFSENIFEIADGSIVFIAGATFYRFSSDGEILYEVTYPGLSSINTAAIDSDGLQFVTLDIAGVEYAMRFMKIHFDGTIAWSYDFPDAIRAWRGELMINGAQSKWMAVGSDHIGNLMCNCVTFDTTGTILFDSLFYPQNDFGSITALNGKFIYSRHDFTTAKVVNAMDSDFNHLWSTNLIEGDYYIYDTMDAVIQLYSGNYVQAINAYDHTSGDAFFYLQYLNSEGDPIFKGPDFLRSPAEGYYIRDIVQLDSNKLAFIGNRYRPQNDGFVLITDTLGTLLHLLVNGKVYYDANTNGVMDADEYGFPNIFIQSDPGPFFGITGYDDQYHLNLFSEGNYTNTCLTPPFWDIADPISYTVSLDPGTGGDTISNKDYRLSYVEPVTELQLSLYQYSIVYGFENYSEITVNNFGNQTVGTVNVELHHPAANTLLTTDPPYDYYSDTTIIWIAHNINPYQPQVFHADFICDDSLITPDETDVTVAGIVGPEPFDIDITNNKQTLNETILTSYDPNHLIVNPQGIGETGLIDPSTNSLQYTISFQNTGASPAINISIIDSIDSHIDFTSIQPVGASDVYWMEAKSPNVIIWHFNNIYLPADFTDHEGSTGYIQYSARLKENLPPGTSIRNKASIYFDMNYPVITNSTINTLSAPGSSEDGEQMIFSVYPNPCQDYSNLQLLERSKNCSYSIFDLQGQLIKTKELPDDILNYTVDPVDLADGLYLIRVTNNGKTSAQRWIVLRHE